MSANDELTEGTNPNFLKPGQKVGGGNFTLIKMLGRGGMGVVWLARDESLNEDVALKFLPPEVAADAIALDDLRRETRKSRRLTHPQIMRIHAFHGAPGEPAFISMEFVDGPNLTSLRLQQQQRCFTWKFLEPLMRQLCGALDYAHGEKIIHRDLKPSNLMLDARGRLKLADFGIAATMSDSMNRVSLQSATSGTLVYMSPQQLRGETPRATDDIYALGATFYELLTSKPPFFRGDIADQVKHEPPQPLAERLHDFEITNPIPEHVKELIMSCLAKNADQRPQSAQEILKRLEAPAPATASSPAPDPNAQTTLEISATIAGPPPSRSAPKPEPPETSRVPAPELTKVPEKNVPPAPEHFAPPPEPATPTDLKWDSERFPALKKARERFETEQPPRRNGRVKWACIGVTAMIAVGVVWFAVTRLGGMKTAQESGGKSSNKTESATNQLVQKMAELVMSLSVPPKLTVGQTFEIRVSIQSDKTISSALRFHRNDQDLGEQKVELSPGTNLFSFPQTLSEPGTYKYKVEVSNGMVPPQEIVTKVDTTADTAVETTKPAEVPVSSTDEQLRTNGWQSSSTVEELQKRADSGDTDAMNELGDRYNGGGGITKDVVEAVKWFRKAADAGDARGEIRLGVMYEFGNGVDKDQTEAFNWFRKAAEKGNAVGENWLGHLYEDGNGVARDQEQAIEWHQKAAAQGFKDSQVALKRLAHPGAKASDVNTSTASESFLAFGPLTNEMAKVSYALGMNVAITFTSNHVNLDLVHYLGGIRDELSGTTTQLSDEEETNLLNRYRQQLLVRRNQSGGQQAGNTNSQGDALLTDDVSGREKVAYAMGMNAAVGMKHAEFNPDLAAC